MLNNKQKKAIKLFNETRDNLSLTGIELVNDLISQNADDDQMVTLKNNWELSVEVLKDVEMFLYDIKAEDKE